MAKRQYTCTCGQFSLKRGKLTRKQYAAAKVVHAQTCETLREELRRSTTTRAAKKGAR